MRTSKEANVLFDSQVLDKLTDSLLVLTLD